MPSSDFDHEPFSIHFDANVRGHILTFSQLHLLSVTFPARFGAEIWDIGEI